MNVFPSPVYKCIKGMLSFIAGSNRRLRQRSSLSQLKCPSTQVIKQLFTNRRYQIDPSSLQRSGNSCSEPSSLEVHTAHLCDLKRNSEIKTSRNNFDHQCVCWCTVDIDYWLVSTMKIASNVYITQKYFS